MPRRARAVFPRTIPALILVSLMACAGALARDAHDKVVRPDSPAVREVYRQPLASDIYLLRVALEKLRYAGDAPAATALERHLAQRALAALGAAPVDTTGSVGDLAAHPPAGDASAVAQVLRSALRAELVRTEGHDLVAKVENRSGHALDRYDAWAKVERPSRDPILLRCHAEPETRKAFQPAEARVHRCEVHGNRFGVDEYFRGIADRWPAGSPLAFELTSARFVDPPVTLSGTSAAWHGDDPHSRAMLDFRALDCRQRAACLEEAKEKYLGPPRVFFLFAAGAGIVAGIVLALAGGRRGRNAAIATLVFVLLGGWAALYGPGALGVGGYGTLILFFLALELLATFLVAFWLSAWMTALLRDRRKPSQEGDSAAI